MEPKPSRLVGACSAWRRRTITRPTLTAPGAADTHAPTRAIGFGVQRRVSACGGAPGGVPSRASRGCVRRSEGILRSWQKRASQNVASSSAGAVCFHGPNVRTGIGAIFGILALVRLVLVVYLSGITVVVSFIRLIDVIDVIVAHLVLVSVVLV